MTSMSLLMTLNVTFKIKDTNDETIALARIQACIDELKAWMIHHRLQLNDSKTEILVITTPSLAGKHNLTDVVNCDSILKPTTVARNLGVMFDSAFNMKSQGSKFCQAAYYHLLRIHAIRDCLTQHATELLVHALVISRLDYGNSLLYGLPDSVIRQAADSTKRSSLSCGKASRHDHVTQILETLHWLPV